MLTFRIDADFHGNAFRLITDSEDLIQNIYSDTPSTAIPSIGYGYALLVKNNRNSYEVPVYLQAEFAEIGITLTQTNIDLLEQIAQDLNQQNTASAATRIAQLDAQIRDITPEEARTLFNHGFDRAVADVESAFIRHSQDPADAACLQKPCAEALK